MADHLQPFEDPARRCLQLQFWPEADRRAWDAALAAGDLLEGTVGPGHHWREETREKYRKGYGRWLTYLIRAGLMSNGQRPAERVTAEHVRGYITELHAQELASWTIWGRLAELLAAIQAMAPEEDFRWLRKVARFHEQGTVDRRNKLQRLQPAHEILDWALGRMDEVTRNPPMRDAAGAYRDALMVALLSICPVRLGNFSAIEIDRHLQRDASGYRLRFAGPETKTGHPFSAPIADTLTEQIDHYLTVVRPILLEGRENPRLWITRYGAPMKPKSIHAAITRTTERAFGRSINPHLFRDCAATFVALEDPKHVGIASPLLGHIDPRAAESHYIQANQIVAGRRIRNSVAKLRKRLAQTKKRNAS
ncbi:tyrosine recombinase XerC [Sedimentimonas flavescens]|uniref:site-specific integrase n=1 Tax=Sedimentimonas flavescens TaxID=2851012 RepID=UPI001C4A6B91|nr:tyrosine-type recombinase/integrase [Sedimentimonas flavescens]MBW0158425.1 hypothetical protein [Sedimentimonas flavescens]